MRKIPIFLFTMTSLVGLGACTSSTDSKDENPIDDTPDVDDGVIFTEEFEDYFDVEIKREDYTSVPDRTDDPHSYVNYEVGADTVILGLIGGPVYGTEMNYFSSNEQLLDFKYELLYVNQSQTFIEDNLDSSRSLEDTQKSANAINNKTVSMINELVLEFKEDGRDVILMGHSYGAFLVPYYISKYGTDDVTLFAAIAGRLDFDGKHEIFYNGGAAYFYESHDVNDKYECDGVEDYISLCLVFSDIMSLTKEQYSYSVTDVSGLTDEEFMDEKYSLYLTRILQGDLGRHNYIDYFTENKSDLTLDLDKFIYLAGGMDQAVGKFNENEKTFATDNLVFMYGPDEGHGVSGLHQAMSDKMKEMLEDTTLVNYNNLPSYSNEVALI